MLKKWSLFTAARKSSSSSPSRSGLEKPLLSRKERTATSTSTASEELPPTDAAGTELLLARTGNHDKIIASIAHRLYRDGEHTSSIDGFISFITVLSSSLRIMLRDRDVGVMCAIQAMCLMERRSRRTSCGDEEEETKHEEDETAPTPTTQLKHQFLAAFILASKLVGEFDSAVSNRYWARMVQGELSREDLQRLELEFCASIGFNLQPMSPEELCARLREYSV